MKKFPFFLAIGTFIASSGLVVFVLFFYDRGVEAAENTQKFPRVIENTKIEEVQESKDALKAGGDTAEVSTEEAEEVSLPPQEDVAFYFTVIGDSERNKSAYGFDEKIFTVIDKAKSMKPDFMLFTGDIIMAHADPRGPEKSIRHVKKVFDTRLADIPYYFVLGYHDVECGTECVEIWQEVFFDKTYEKGEERIAYHSFDYENTHFTLLSTDYPEKRTIDADQLKWFEDDLKNNEKDNTIVVMHVPPVTFYEESAKDCHDFACQPELQARLQRIFEKYDVDLVIAGHEKAFDHKIVNGVHYMLSGNSTGGKRVYKGVAPGQTFSDVRVRNKKIIIRGIDMEKGIIREVRVK